MNMSEQISTPDTNHAFYAEGGVSLIEYQAHLIDKGVLVHLGRTTIMNTGVLLDSAIVDDKLREVAMSRTVIEHKESSFDIGIANATATKGTIVMPATANSSLDNVGNGYELAAAAVRYPNHRLVYVASPGQGASSPMSKADAAYYRQSGRLVRGAGDDAQPVDYVVNMYRALASHGIDITHLSADSIGNQFAQALGAAMEPGQLEAGHFSESTGFVDLGLIEVGKGMVYTEDRKNKAWNIERSFDPEKLTDAMQDRYGRAAELYTPIIAKTKIDKSRSSKADQAKAFWTNLQGLRHGPKHGDFPLADDANAMLMRQPQARLVYSLGELDPLYNGPRSAHDSAQAFLRKLVLTDGADVRTILIPDMTHKINTYFPGLYHAIKRHALFG